MSQAADRLRRFIAPLSVVTLIVSCGPGPVEAETIQVRLSQGVAPWTDPAVAWAASATSIGVRAAIETPCNPYILAAVARRIGTELVLRVEGRESDTCSGAQPVPITYDAEVLDLPAGTWRLRVVHVHREWDVAPVTVFVGAITIPQLP